MSSFMQALSESRAAWLFYVLRAGNVDLIPSGPTALCAVFTASSPACDTGHRDVDRRIGIFLLLYTCVQ